MKDICVITGGGSGMGLAAARLLGREYKLIITGRTKEKLERAVKELENDGLEAELFVCDVSDRENVKALAAYAAKSGTVKAVINAAGLSPHMADAEKIFGVNAIGTVNTDEEFAAVMTDGGCILNIASMAGYLIPDDKIPKDLYPLCGTDLAMLSEKLCGFFKAVPENYQSAIAYTVSKNFVIWYTRKAAVLFGEKNIRVLSVSPGTFETPMNKAESASDNYTQNAVLKRLGQPEEMAELIAFVMGDKCRYLCGTDILCDGGVVAAYEFGNTERR